MSSVLLFFHIQHFLCLDKIKKSMISVSTSTRPWWRYTGLELLSTSCVRVRRHMSSLDTRRTYSIFLFWYTNAGACLRAVGNAAASQLIDKQFHAGPSWVTLSIMFPAIMLALTLCCWTSACQQQSFAFFLRDLSLAYSQQTTLSSIIVCK